MAKCARCKAKKAKRTCPALATNLCPLCCGLIREKKIHCPSNCVYLAQHQTYQENKFIQKKHPYPDEVFDDERLNWLALNIMAPIAERAEKDSSFTDKEALLALEYAREKVEKDKSRLLLPTEKTSLQNNMGEAIFKGLESCHYKRKIILLGELAEYKKEEKLRCLEGVIYELKYFAANNWGGRNYLEELSRRFSRLKELREKQKIILSS